MVALAQLILNLPPLYATMLLPVVVAAATLRSPALRGYEIGSSYNLPWSSDGAEKLREDWASNIHSLVEGSCIP